MKKIVVSLAIVVAVVWLVATFAAKSRKGTVVAREWPMGLGRLVAVPDRYPRQTRSAAARELERLASGVGIEFAKRSGPQAPDAIAEYVRSQLHRADRIIEPAPPLPPQIAAVRAHLLSNQPLVWDVDIAKGASAPLPNLLAHMRLSRLLTASALERARLGDPGAWDDLRAQHELSRGLWQRPELISALIALAIDRNVIAAARKMPLPAPSWFDEIRTFDHRRAMLAAMQAETWTVAAAIREYSAGDDAGRNWVRRLFDRTVRAPYTLLSRSDLVARQRETAIEIAKMTTCALEPPADNIPWWNKPAQFLTPSITAAWLRVFRVRAELELTEHALGLRSGPQSRCSDGHWIVTHTSVKFSRPIPLPGPAYSATPLEISR